MSTEADKLKSLISKMTEIESNPKMEYVGPNVDTKLSYDNWLKKVKKIKKGAHGITGPQHTKYSKEWKTYRGHEIKGLYK